MKTEMADSASKLFNREYAKACKVFAGGGNGKGKDGPQRLQGSTAAFDRSFLKRACISPIF